MKTVYDYSSAQSGSNAIQGHILSINLYVGPLFFLVLYGHFPIAIICNAFSILKASVRYVSDEFEMQGFRVKGLRNDIECSVFLSHLILSSYYLPLTKT